MDSKKIRKSIGRFFGWLGLSISSLIVQVLPGAWVYGFGRGIAWLGYAFARKQRVIALESLRIAFKDEKSAQEREVIARDCFTSMAKSAVELLFFMERFALLKKQVSIVGKENLDAALAKGKGVILVSAHFGNFPLLLGRLSLAGYHVGAIMRPMRDTRVEKIFLRKREKLNIRTIYSQPRKTCVEHTIRSLRSNEIIFIPLDQNFGTGGVFVDFFGTKAATATGPVILAQRTKAALVPCFIVRQPDDTHKIIFEPAVTLPEGTDTDYIRGTIQQLTTIIERYIRLYPAEWGWIHRRWKSRPQTEGGL
jgi:KDO2-lipid IV(A) lauroyltransferase